MTTLHESFSAVQFSSRWYAPRARESPCVRSVAQKFLWRCKLQCWSDWSWPVLDWLSPAFQRLNIYIYMRLLSLPSRWSMVWYCPSVAVFGHVPGAGSVSSFWALQSDLRRRNYCHLWRPIAFPSTESFYSVGRLPLTTLTMLQWQQNHWSLRLGGR